MHRYLALFLASLLLLQTFSRELLVLDYQVHKKRVTELFCVNKDRPQLQCNGKCHLRKTLRKAETDSKAPTVASLKIKYEVLPTVQLLLPKQTVFPCAAAGYAPTQASRLASRPQPGIFHPPLLRA